MARVAMIGGHGKVGLRLSRLLTEHGHQVTSLFRKPEQAEDVRRTGATPEPAALGVVVGSGPYAYRRDDGVWVLPIGGIGP